MGKRGSYTGRPGNEMGEGILTGRNKEEDIRDGNHSIGLHICGCNSDRLHD